jgi:protein gp37
MADNTKIEWADATLNYANGCSRVSPGCGGPGPHGGCYAELLAGTRLRNHPTRIGLTKQTSAGPRWTGDVRIHEPALQQALAWKRGRKIFWNAHGDLFHKNVTDEQIDRLFAVCGDTPQHTHMILTKRSPRMREYLTKRKAAKPIMVPIGNGLLAQHPFNNELQAPANVWLGVSIEDQQRADERLPDLLATPASMRFISAEPLLGPLEFDPCDLARLDWVIVGGESGPKARPMHPDWARSLRDQCAIAGGVPFLFKQWGEWAPVCVIGEDLSDTLYRARLRRHEPEGPCRCKVDQLVMQACGRVFPMDEWSKTYGEDPDKGDFAFLAGSGAMQMMRVGKRAAGRLLDGREWSEFPA